ncbi:MAG TPA: endonuclease III [Planctomycetota bacterium]|nr:endonuclease III [Planctomycetota bacterium]
MPKRRAPESPRARASRALAIAARLHQAHPDAHCALVHRDPYQLLVATILSAQCTDERVNVVTPVLFERAPTPADVLRLPEGELERIIRSTGFFNAKARSIRGAAKLLVERFGGRVPRTMEELLELPGVARKTANVVLGTGYGIPSGFVVDTHVHRLARRLGLTTEDDPVKIEADLRSLFPPEEWIFLGHALIFHGRRICSARAPSCDACPIADLCPSRGLPADAWKVKPKLSARPSRGGSDRPSRGRTARTPARAGSPGGRRGSGSSRSRRA